MTTDHSAPSTDSHTIHLPSDIYLEILKVLPASREDESSIKTLVSCLSTNSIVRTAALSPLVWVHHYRARYIHSIDINEVERKLRTSGDWRLLYIERRWLDRRALLLADEIRMNATGRHEKAREFARELSLDVFDALRLESRLPLPSCLEKEGEDIQPDRADEDILPRRFWAQSILGMIARYEATDVWERVFMARADDPPVPFVEALSSFSAVFDASMQEVKTQLDTIYEACVERMKRHHLVHASTELQRRCITLCQVLYSPEPAEGFGLAEGVAFQRLLNQFPHSFLQRGNRHTIPMSLVFVFVAMARRMGINASPVNYPGAVQAHVLPKDPSESSFLLDVASDNPAPVPVGDVPSGLDADMVQPASSLTMLMRAFNNIISFARFERILGPSPGAPNWSFEAQDSAFYLMTMCTMLRSQPMNSFPAPPEFNPLDLVAVLLDKLTPKLPTVSRNMLTKFLNDSWKASEDRASQVRHRDATSQMTGFVGMVFEHRRYKYIGCIYAWDPVCAAAESWIENMRVNQLPSGRDQPFYSSFSADGQAFYVAQDNIVPISLDVDKIRSLFMARKSFGRYFTGFERAPNKGRLTLTHEMKVAYPDDDAYGAEWLADSSENKSI
ncbi:hypothetical protein EIP91_006935 [Steccherinum ochraceum]|uniref:Hemimethylated DNA-binding domain-containing protein n=1 Tax=Steccherinum ochraceum TaxID=92696 RepID=A0A4V2MVK2_9APHY|nr:hypothetical protein EIP91_006935 [Steccherinum ochraceum]